MHQQNEQHEAENPEDAMKAGNGFYHIRQACFLILSDRQKPEGNLREARRAQFSKRSKLTISARAITAKRTTPTTTATEQRRDKNMKMYREESLRNFEFWSGAKDRANVLTEEQFDQIEAMLEEIEPDGMDETAINDLFWFAENTIAEWLGFEDFEALERFNNGEEEEEEEEDEEE